MTLLSVHKSGPSPQALPAAVVFSRQLLLSENSSVTVVLASTSAEAKLLALLASRMTAMRENQGYNHFGINE